MATIVLSALGTVFGGPVGGALGALFGRQLDRAIVGTPSREGPRLKELAVTTSSYGTPIARQHGKVRAGGTLIWATELAESSESTGGKGQPTLTTYAYSASFAVALSSRPIHGIGRIWADGNLLRGAAGDLKTGGAMRVYDGHGDQPVDPLIASDKGALCPAFRNIAYVVFEDLQLADFGNRIPALTFEIVADEGPIALADLLEPVRGGMADERPLEGLLGLSVEGGPLHDVVAVIDPLWPVALDAGGAGLRASAADEAPAAVPMLSEPVVASGEDGTDLPQGKRLVRAPADAPVPAMLRYYDAQRDYLAGTQHADGRARPGRPATIELPATLSAPVARVLVNRAAARAGSARESCVWRTAELDPSLGPGAIVRAPGHVGFWRIAGWEWTNEGIELELARLPSGDRRAPVGDAGELLAPVDDLATPTALVAYELPWGGTGDSGTPAIYAAIGSSGSGWSGAALHAEDGGPLVPLGGSGSRRSTLGRITAPLGPSAALLLERDATVEVELISTDFVLDDADPAEIANGANRALIGSEIVQFARAERLAGANWRLTGLLRGRGGTEPMALGGQPEGADFVLLDVAPVRIDAARLPSGAATRIVASGLADAEPVERTIINRGLTRRPLAPVHPRATFLDDGSLLLRWTRRARGGWLWLDEVDVSLVEQGEAYRVGLGPADAPHAMWEVAEPTLVIAQSTLLTLAAAHPGSSLWVRQVGSFAASAPLLLATV